VADITKQIEASAKQRSEVDTSYSSRAKKWTARKAEFTKAEDGTQGREAAQAVDEAQQKAAADSKAAADALRRAPGFEGLQEVRDGMPASNSSRLRMS